MLSFKEHIIEKHLPCRKPRVRTYSVFELILPPIKKEKEIKLPFFWMAQVCRIGTRMKDVLEGNKIV